MQELHVRRLHDRARLPHRAHNTDLGYDLYTPTSLTIDAKQQARVMLGIACSFPENWGALIKDRSSLAARGLHTTGGVIDAGYQGEIQIIIVNLSDAAITINAGDRIAQMVPTPVVGWVVKEVSEFNNSSERGAGGFGSTGQ